MNIEISDNEYRDLLDILHIADVVMSGHRKGQHKRTERHRALIQKFYSLAAGRGLDWLISYNENLNKYISTAEFEESSPAHAMIDEFGDHVFWDELISRLSTRDAAQTVGGIERFNAMTDSERQHLEGPIRQRYLEEFAASGVANLAVIEGFSAGAGLPVKTSD